jgi:transcriptional regulator with XRE-family HTH domain
MQTWPVLASVAMPRRPVFYPELGAFFLALREERGWNQSEAASLASRRQLSALTRQVLLRLEKGKTKNPEPDVLRDLAALYEVPYDDLVARWVNARYGVKPRDLTRHADGEDGSFVGGAGDPAATRLLEEERTRTREIGEDIHNVIHRLTLIAAKTGAVATRDEDRSARSDTPGRSQGDRTARRRRAR